MREVLVISNYYPPETGAASNRIFHLAERLKSQGYQVKVVCPLPNYPHGQIFKDYRWRLGKRESHQGISVHRLWILASRSKNKFIRLISMMSFSLSLAIYLMTHRKPGLVIIQSPPLLVANTALRFTKSNKRTVVLNVSDLWPLAGLKLGAFKENGTYRRLESIEKANYRKADLIMGQSQEILDHVNNIVSDKPTFLYRNYPEIRMELKAAANNGTRIRMVYAGLLGVAQGIFKLIQELDYGAIEFHIYGTGPERKEIESYIEKHSDLPLYYHGELARKELHETLGEYDLTIIPLLTRIYGSVPSKIFEYAKLGLPILYFGGGEGEDIVEKYKLGWSVEVGNYEKLNIALNNIHKSGLGIEVRRSIYEVAHSQFDLKSQVEALLRKIEMPDQ